VHAAKADRAAAVKAPTCLRRQALAFSHYSQVRRGRQRKGEFLAGCEGRVRREALQDLVEFKET
jgi:hypothetical protein